jgi:transcriptional regulator with XRE-family HTH domain
MKNIVGQNIKKYRILSGLKQQELAEAMGKRTGTIQKYEYGQIFPPIPVLDEIAKIFDINVNSLVSDSYSETKDFLEMNLFGENLKNIRSQKNLRQSDLSKISGVSTNTISLIENNILKPRVRTLKKLAAALEIPLKTLIGDCEVQIPEEDDDRLDAELENISFELVKIELVEIFDNLNETAKRRLIEIARDFNKLYRDSPPRVD